MAMDLSTFYTTHIEGHIKDELILGNDICSACYDLWPEIPAEMKEDINYVFDAKLTDFYMDKMVEKFHMPRELLQDAYNFALDFQTYSDWYKDENGIRPRYF